MVRYPNSGIPGGILLVFLIVSLTCPVSGASDGSLVIEVSDGLTKNAIDGAQVYLDGGYRGTTTSTDKGGVLVIPGVSAGAHTIRVTKTDYKQITKKISYPVERTDRISLSKGALVSLNPDGAAPDGIGIVL